MNMVKCIHFAFTIVAHLVVHCVVFMMSPHVTSYHILSYSSGCPLSPTTADSVADITVFPDMIRFHRVHIDQIATLLNYILLDKQYNHKVSDYVRK